MAEVARARSRFLRHRFFGGWTPRRILAVCTLAALALLFVRLLDPRLRACFFWIRAPHPMTMPVAGLPLSSVHSTWHQGRPDGRRHEGVDLFAPRGTQVIAAASGRLWFAGRNSLGGNTVTIVGAGWRVYYYAHLDTWAPGLEIGETIRAGTVLGGVGNTGDAAGLPTHLHFGVTQLSFFGAHPIDPAPLLSSAQVLPGALIANGVKEPPVTTLHAGGREDLAMP